MIIKKEKTKLYSLMDTDLFLDTSNRDYVLKIRDLPNNLRPKDKLINSGPESLSMAELLSIIWNTGNQEEDVLEMSNRVVKEYGEKSIFSENDADKLSNELNITISKACQLIACGELGRRTYKSNNSGLYIIRNAKDVYEYLQDMHNLPKEHLRGLYLNSHNRIIHDEVISIGTINSNIIHPREVFRPALAYNAVAVVIAHNHPSNIATPSSQDIEITNQIIQAGRILGINVLDHVIITKNTYMSIKANY
jgi:DNA repair protein RadC